MELLKEMKNDSIDLICTDPPYKCTSRGHANKMGGYWKNEKTNKGIIFDDNNISCKQYLPEFYRVLKNGTHCYIMTNHINLMEMLNVATESGFKFVKSLIWNKGNQICSQFYMNCFEYILMFRKGEARAINNCSTPDILNISVNKLKDDEGNNLHDTEKPIKLMKILIENSTDEGQTVFEPFAGIGSTVIASKELNRHCIGCEINTEYAEIITKRLKNTLFSKNSDQLLLF